MTIHHHNRARVDAIAAALAALDPAILDATFAFRDACYSAVADAEPAEIASAVRRLRPLRFEMEGHA